jgi:hypothetical protein
MVGGGALDDTHEAPMNVLTHHHGRDRRRLRLVRQ